ncbi:MAG TPA: YqhA family protein [Chthoniobacterales bacterium]|jgi:hypothetical protein|nr:YqhA family protein [Chthoniobacterales bacterium]
MNWWKKGFEIGLWNSRLIVALAVVTSVLAAVALFCIIGIESLRVLANVFHYLDPTMVLEQREALLRERHLAHYLPDRWFRSPDERRSYGL